jgi:hypothetical protein
MYKFKNMSMREIYTRMLNYGWRPNVLSDVKFENLIKRPYIEFIYLSQFGHNNVRAKCIVYKDGNVSGIYLNEGATTDSIIEELRKLDLAKLKEIYKTYCK